MKVSISVILGLALNFSGYAYACEKQAQADRLVRSYYTAHDIKEVVSVKHALTLYNNAEAYQSLCGNFVSFISHYQELLTEFQNDTSMKNRLHERFIPIYNALLHQVHITSELFANKHKNVKFIRSYPHLNTVSTSTDKGLVLELKDAHQELVTILEHTQKFIENIINTEPVLLDLMIVELAALATPDLSNKNKLTLIEKIQTYACMQKKCNLFTIQQVCNNLINTRVSQAQGKNNVCKLISHWFNLLYTELYDISTTSINTSTNHQNDVFYTWLKFLSVYAAHIHNKDTAIEACAHILAVVAHTSLMNKENFSASILNSCVPIITASLPYLKYDQQKDFLHALHSAYTTRHVLPALYILGSVMVSGKIEKSLLEKSGIKAQEIITLCRAVANNNNEAVWRCPFKALVPKLYLLEKDYSNSFELYKTIFTSSCSNLISCNACEQAVMDCMDYTAQFYRLFSQSDDVRAFYSLIGAMNKRACAINIVNIFDNNYIKKLAHWYTRGFYIYNIKTSSTDKTCIIPQDLDKALQLYQQLSFHDYYHALYWKAQIFIKQKRYDDALNILNIIINSHDDQSALSTSAHIERIHISLVQNSYDNVIAESAKMLKGSSLTQHEKGLLYYMQATAHILKADADSGRGKTKGNVIHPEHLDMFYRGIQTMDSSQILLEDWHVSPVLKVIEYFFNANKKEYKRSLSYDSLYGKVINSYFFLLKLLPMTNVYQKKYNDVFGVISNQASVYGHPYIAAEHIVILDKQLLLQDKCKILLSNNNNSSIIAKKLETIDVIKSNLERGVYDLYPIDKEDALTVCAFNPMFANALSALVMYGKRTKNMENILKKLIRTSELLISDMKDLNLDIRMQFIDQKEWNKFLSLISEKNATSSSVIDDLTLYAYNSKIDVKTRATALIVLMRAYYGRAFETTFTSKYETMCDSMDIEIVEKYLADLKELITDQDTIKSLDKILYNIYIMGAIKAFYDKDRDFFMHYIQRAEEVESNAITNIVTIGYLFNTGEQENIIQARELLKQLVDSIEDKALKAQLTRALRVYKDHELPLDFSSILRMI
ncbi:hypothetical protein J120_02970 [candidate division TM6 bacterium JCVI TM6SC1]|uniref:Uncharacterized protein n=1 Tax=candidate division TM6 bacterium JCVI TM6SC1 TaxID=1306947 RepID=A0A0D2JLQ1_9BACT|nr:hypothetical protein J120_02970 [candidate division TM6 bacterium JCVI TM6SC1]